MTQKDSAEKAVRDIRRKTRRKFSAEEKIRDRDRGYRPSRRWLSGDDGLTSQFGPYSAPGPEASPLAGIAAPDRQTL